MTPSSQRLWAGGEGFCVIVGLYDDVDADCGHPEGYACAWLGVSFG